jgi:hypothetical protein
LVNAHLFVNVTARNIRIRLVPRNTHLSDVLTSDDGVRQKRSLLFVIAANTGQYRISSRLSLSFLYREVRNNRVVDVLNRVKIT